MKTKIYLFIFTLISLIGCNQTPTIIVVDGNKPDTIMIEPTKKPVVVITKADKALIDSFRPAIRDVAYYYILNSNKSTSNGYTWKCGDFKLWIGNGVDFVGLHYPLDEDFTLQEKRFFWNLYQNYKNTKRLFEYEDEIEIIIK